VGLSNYPEHSSAYVLRPGRLDYVQFIAERRLAVHNAFLSVLVEGGLIGLALLAAAVAACLLAAWRARRLFARAGRPELAGLASAALAASLGALTAAAFLPDSSDVQLWLVLGAGPALLRVARRGPNAASARGPDSAHRRRAVAGTDIDRP
jgi:O-antigen ligase